MVNNYPRAFFETPYPRPFLNNLAAGLVAGNDILIAFRAFPGMLPVNCPYVASAYGAGLGFYQHLAVRGFWNGHVF
jgi:hypothetical protein